MSTFNFGDENAWDVNGNCGNYIVGIAAACPQSGKAISISAYIANIYGQAGLKAKAALYSSGGSLLGQSAEKSITSTSFYWETWNLITPVNVVAATYIIVIWGNIYGGRPVYFKAHADATSPARYKLQTYNSFPSSVSFSTQAYTYSIYCTVQIPVVGGEYGLGKTHLVMTL